MAPLTGSRAARLMALALLATVGLGCGGGAASPSPTGAGPFASPGATATSTATATATATATPTPGVTPTILVTPSPTKAPTATPKVYTLVDLGTIDAGAESILVGVNNSGAAATANFRWVGGVKKTLLPAPGQTSVRAANIGNSGYIVGAGCAAYCHATRWSDPATPRDLGTLGGHSSHAINVSDSGIVVGVSDITGSSTWHAFRQSGTAAMVDLNTAHVGPVPMFGDLREAWDINSSGTIVGWAGPNGDPRAFKLTASGTLSEVGPLPGYPNAQARAINNLGHIAGFSGDGVHITGMILIGTSLTAIPGLSGYELMHPYAINESDVVVGCSRKQSDDSLVHAFRFASGHTVDLNSFLPGGSGWTLECATDISDDGRIVGTGTLGGNNHAFMLIPA